MNFQLCTVVDKTHNPTDFDIAKNDNDTGSKVTLNEKEIDFKIANTNEVNIKVKTTGATFKR